MDELNAFERTVAYELSLMSGPHSNVDAASIAAAVAEAAPRRGSDGRGRMLKSAAIVVLVLGFAAIVAVIIASLGGGSETEGPATTAPASTPAVDATATPLPPTPEPTIAGAPLTSSMTWTRGGIPASERADAVSMAVAPNGAILLVAGATEANDRAHGWVSRDGGATWAPTNLGLRRREGVEPTSAVATDAGFIVVGFGDDGGIVQSSPDGLAWTRLATLPDVRFHELQATDDGLIARGVQTSGRNRDQRAHPAYLTSADGLEWDVQRIATVGTEPREALPTDLQSIDMARSDTGITLVTGSHLRGGVEGLIVDRGDGATAATGLYWRSADGASWVPLRLPTTEAAPGTPIDPARASELIWTPRGFFLATQAPAGERAVREGIIWRSEDGVLWEQVADAGNTFVAELASGGPDLLAFTTPVAERNSDGVWLLVNTLDPELSSADGETWDTWDDPVFSRFEVVEATVTDDGRVIAIGYERIPGEPERKVAPVWQLLTGTPAAG